ncbi:MAG: hypothetical protein M3T56_16265 [Chloroflexota bacterium]|nr:hypothetical protein [Chloroflexota bacterium]
MEARVLVGVRLAGRNLSLLRCEDLSELRDLRLGDPFRGERRDRGLDETTELDDVSERVATRDEACEWTCQVVGRRLAYEGAAAGSGLDYSEKLEGAQRFADRSTRDLELFGELPLGRELVAWAEVALLEQTLDLLDDALIEAASADRLDDCQGALPPQNRSGQVVRPELGRAYGGSWRPSNPTSG